MTRLTPQKAVSIYEQEGIPELRPCFGWSRYVISADGQVYSLLRNQPTMGRLLRTHSGPNGYVYIALRKQYGTNGPRRSVALHRLVWLSWRGPVPNKMCLDHIDGNKKNNALSNLEPVTHSENHRRAFRLGLRSMLGEKNPQSKFTTDIVIWIRYAVSFGVSQKRVARLLNTTTGAVNLIVRRKRWNHVD